MSLLQELSQRNVYQTIGGYLAMGWFLLKSGEVVFPLFGLPLWSFRALVLFLVAAFPIVMFVAWRYRITPEGLAGHEFPEGREEAPVLRRSRRFENWIVVALVAVAIVATAVSAGLRQSGGAAPRSVAVLPFVNMSGDDEQEFFADGLTEELLNVLAKVPDLRVAGRTSSFAFKGRNEDLREIGKQLNVRVLLEGSVRRDGENLRVTAQLIDVASGYHLFSETYDRRAVDVFRIQDDIARRVVQEIKYELLERDSGIFVATGPDPEAYENYLRSRRAVSQRLLGELKGAIASLEEMLALEPNFARGWSALADAYAVASQYGVVAKEDAEGPLEAAARRALELDPALSEAHVSMGMMEALRGESSEQVLRHFREAVRLNPNNPEAQLWLAISLPRTNGGEVRAVLEKAYALDPLHPIIGYRYVVALAQTGNIDRAWQVVQAMRTTGNAASSYLKVSAMLHYLTGDVAGAALASLKDLERNPGDVFSLAGLAYYGAVLGFDEEVEELLAQGLSAYPDYIHLRVEQIRLLSDPGAKRAISPEKDIILLSKNSDRESGYFLGSIYASRGQCADAYREFQKVFGSNSASPWDVDAILRIDLYGGANVMYALRCAESDRAKTLFQDYEEHWQDLLLQGFVGWLPAFRLAAGYAAMGESAEALRWLQEAVDAGLPPLRRLRLDTWLANLPNHEGFPGEIDAVLATRLVEQRSRLEQESFGERMKSVALRVSNHRPLS